MRTRTLHRLHADMEHVVVVPVTRVLAEEDHAVAVLELVAAAHLVALVAEVRRVEVMVVVVELLAHIEPNMNPSTDAAKSSETHGLSRGLLISLVVVVALGVLGVGYERYQSKKTQETIADAVTALTRGQFGVANETIAKVNGDSASYQAQIIAESSKFLSRDAKVRLEGVSLLKANYISLEGQPEFQAGTIGRLFDYLQGSSNDLFVAVFTGAPFANYFVPNDRLATLKNLAEHSLSLQKTSQALFQIADWHASKIIKHFDKETLLSEMELSQEVAETQGLVHEADSLYPTEKTGLINPAFGYLYDGQFFSSRGYLYGVLALANKTYLTDAQYSYKQVHNIYDLQVNAEGVGPALLASRLPYIDLSLALFLKATSGTTEADAIQKSIQDMTTLVAKNPSLHQNFFVSYVRSIKTGKSNGLWLSGSRIRSLALKYPDLKNFLVQNGWSF